MQCGSSDHVAHETIDLQGITLALGMPREEVMKDLQSFSLRQEGKDDYWNISSASDSSKWIGSVLFKHKKLALVIKSWAQADDKTINGVIKRMMSTRTSCAFSIAGVPSQNSPLRLTTLACPERQVVIQVGEDKEAELVKCDVEVLGDPGERLRDVAFWKACR